MLKKTPDYLSKILRDDRLTDGDDTEVFCQRRNFVKEDRAGYVTGANSQLNIHTQLTHGAEPFLRSRQLCSFSRTSQHFMEPEGSLPCSQEPSTGPYPEPNQSNPYNPILSL
jgi:hypothetical protein